MRRLQFVQRFVRPLVEGGELHVGAPLGMAGVEGLASERRGAAEAERLAEEERLLSAARWAVARECLCDAAPPLLDEDALRLSVALHDLLFLAHPEAPASPRLRARVAQGSASISALPATSEATALVERHSLLHRVTQLVRIDSRLSFWAGRQEFRGQSPPARLRAWPQLRRVHVEEWKVGCLAEVAADAGGGGEAARALLRQSPLTNWLSAVREGPPLDELDLVGVAGALADPRLARLVCYRTLEAGLDGAGAVLAAAVVRALGVPALAEDARFALALIAHLHLCLIVGSDAGRAEAVRAARRGEPDHRDLFGLFAALHTADPEAALPVDARGDARLVAAAADHAAECAQACGTERTEGLAHLVARALGQLPVPALAVDEDPDAGPRAAL